MADLISIRQVYEVDRSWILKVVQDEWGDVCVVVHQQIFYPHQLSGFVAEAGHGERIGLVTYQILEDHLEIITLNSFLEGRGIGAALVAAVKNKARELNFSRIHVSTTNDNQRAIAFYLHQGFVQIELLKGAVDQARLLKPSIPEFSADGIPIKDELVFELVLVDDGLS